MAGQIDAKLQELGITIPEAAAPVANYVGWVKSGSMVFVSGQVTLQDGDFKYIGKLGRRAALRHQHHCPAQGRLRR